MQKVNGLTVQCGAIELEWRPKPIEIGFAVFDIDPFQLILFEQDLIEIQLISQSLFRYDVSSNLFVLEDPLKWCSGVDDISASKLIISSSVQK